MHGLERMVGGIGRESFACAMRGAPGGCTCCPEGLTLSSSLPPMVAFYRMLQSKSVFVNSGDLIQARRVGSSGANTTSSALTHTTTAQAS